MSAGTMLRVALTVAVTGAIAAPAAAQSRPAAQAVGVHAFFDVGGTVLTAGESFKAVTGSRSGFVFGGGGGVVLPQQIFVDVRLSRLVKNGHRVFVADGEVFGLGIENRITITPLDVTAGYRFGRGGLIPYAGGGLSLYRYQETDAFATDDEAATDRFTGYHLLGGAEYRLHRLFSVAGELQWTSVPDALGENAGSVGIPFDETNLGGTAFRIKIVVGR